MRSNQTRAVEFIDYIKVFLTIESMTWRFHYETQDKAETFGRTQDAMFMYKMYKPTSEPFSLQA